MNVLAKHKLCIKESMLAKASQSVHVSKSVNVEVKIEPFETTEIASTS